MATEDPTTDAPEAASPPPPAENQPNYPEMIMAAIESIDCKNGSNKSAISKYIEANYTDLPPTLSTLLPYHLNKMKLSGEIVLVKNNYMKPDPNAAPKRGRGRPPKPKSDTPPTTAAVASSPRPRGRPPKPKDPFAPAAPAKTAAAPAVSGRKRGRPPKKAKAQAAPKAAPPPAAAVDGTVVKRGRGRPPKVKPAVSPVGA